MMLPPKWAVTGGMRDRQARRLIGSRLSPPGLLICLLLSLLMISIPSSGAQPKASVKAVTLDENGLCLDGSYVPLVSGEIHYWRLNPLFWRDCLNTMKEAGLDIVSTYVPWNFHELEPGRFDFRGETSPTRDLAGFLDLCSEMGLRVIIRPGPYINAEWIGGGLPADILGLDHLHPRYMSRSVPYIKAIGSVLAPRQITRGGPIILCQVENEIFFPRSGRSEYAFGSGRLDLNYDGDLVMGKYVDWLRKHFASIEQMNTIYKTSYREFSDVAPPNYREDHLAASLNSLRFVSDEIAGYFEWLAGQFRQAGIEVPLFTNTGMQIVFYDYERLEEIIDSVGLDIYMQPGLPGDEPLTAIWYNALFRDRMKFPWSPEFQSGIWYSWSDDFGYVPGEHMKYLTLLSLASGLRGLNYYMFVARDQWSCAPVDELGRKNPQFGPMSEAIHIARLLEPDDRLARVGLIWHLEHNHKFLIDHYDDWVHIGRYWLDRQGPKELKAWWETFKILVEADIDFEIVRLPGADLGKYEALIYAGADFVDLASLRSIVAFCNEGGTLLTVTSLPSRDENLQTPRSVDTLAETLASAANVLGLTASEIPVRLADLGVQSLVQSSGRGLLTSIYRSRADRNSYVLFAVNRSDREVTDRLKLDRSLFEVADEWVLEDLATGHEQLSSKKDLNRLDVFLPPRDAVVYRIQPHRQRSP